MRNADVSLGRDRVRRAYKFRMHPTARQHVALAACVEVQPELYNAALQERRDAWVNSKTRIRYGDQSAQLTDIRSVRPDQAVWSFSSQQATLRRLNRAFAGFFRRVKAGQKAGYPRFKGAARFDSVEWPKDGDGARWMPEQRRVYLQGIGEVRVDLHREVQGRVKTIQIKRVGRRWMLVLSFDDVPTKPLLATGRQAGIDVGIVSFATTSDGEHIENPRWGRAAADRLTAAQQRLQRATRRSKNRDRKRESVAARRTARSPTSAKTFTTNKPAPLSHDMTCWWWRTCRSPTWCGGPNPCPTPTTPAGI
jgi:putative transposase